ncbi:hypothetical protein KC343_g14881 [Hortaea werneckii]|nr:hypothetical protein KC352_g25324 [Hortaea werneckii]KAI7562065.1 hypothetical protein KC317_g8659 [Hortaea werneckii]KAI7602341.1 hypothetical protein KC343_g14881 [Hortaea werneckii]KAI7611492.1 hypothetical protein KC346_g8258 [Hortaea werneckii]KAI7662373.1 hypothetical protein KC319_g8130 [Hortaea werneckii]
MNSTAAMTGWKAALLKHTAFLMGLSSTGTKAEIAHAVQQRARQASQALGRRRVISVDMGIRNLAYCVVDMPHTETFAQRQHISQLPITVRHWSKRDLLLGLQHQQDPSEALAKEVREPASTIRKNVRRSSNKDVPPKAAFTPSALSKVAYEVVTGLLQHEPDVILIERQRFRSGGQAAVQEWTVRVNMLESMLWACLHTLHETKLAGTVDFPVVHAINPASVANFWVAGKHMDLEPQAEHYRAGSGSMELQQPLKLPRKKIEKKDKVQIVRAWIEGSRDDVDLHFEAEAAQTADLFNSKGRGSRPRQALPVTKLDDLADSLLQALAWTRWEQNSRRIGELLSDLNEKST